MKRIAVLGPLADQLVINNYSGTAPASVTGLQGMRDRVGSNVEITYGVGATVGGKTGASSLVPDESKTDPKAALAEAVELAKKADVALVFVGTNAAVGGHAIADVIFGDVNPAGRLPHTVYAAEAQLPPLDQYDVTTGFTYMYVNGEPLYPFGHGLSYTSFKYSGLKLSSEKTKADGSVEMAAMAQRWILDHPAVTTVITGASRPSQVAANASSSGLPPLSAEIHASLHDFDQRQVRTHIRGPY